MLLSTVVFGLLAATASAQVSTSCQPLNGTCPADPAFGMDYTFPMNGTPPTGTWDATAGTVTYSPTDGAAFTINKQGDSPTIRTSFYIFFGRVELWMKVASGTGIISSVMFLSDDLDEIDWEFMGGNATHAETNYFGKGVQDYHNAIYYPVNGGVLNDYHNYTTHWTKDALDFYIDGTKVRTLLPKDANNTLYYPQTPSRLSLGIWAGGDPTLPEGTRIWAGGDTDYSKGPFTMYVKDVQITDFSSGKEYTYGDTTGSWESIKITEGNSTIHEELTKEPKKSLAQKWRELAPGARIAVYACSGAVGAVLAGLLILYCCRQRRRGREEARQADIQFARERVELDQYQKLGINPDALGHTGIQYGGVNRDSRVVSVAGSMSGRPGSAIPAGYTDEKAWAAAATAVPNSPLQSPMRSASPYSSTTSLRASTPQQSYTPLNDAPSLPYPLGAPSLGAANQMRSFSTPPEHMQSSSHDLGGADFPRSQSPAYMATNHQPQRSFSTNTFYAGARGAYGRLEDQGGSNMR